MITGEKMGKNVSDNDREEQMPASRSLKELVCMKAISSINILSFQK